MAHGEPVLSRGGANLPLPSALPESAFLSAWDDDIGRAARAAADGDRVYEQDLAQVARMRLLVANRALPNAPTPYVRTVIANAVRSEIRRNRRNFGARSPMAQELKEDLEVPASDQEHASAAAVAAWTTRLPARLRDVYRHLYVEERSQREAARLMNVSQPRIAQLHRQLLQRAREDLAHLAA